LHGVLLAHVAEHAFVARSHALPDGQSAALVHPHALFTQLCPEPFDVQSTHAAPGAPHVVGELEAQLSATSQHEPLHACASEHDETH
jgi:hypothetical protein